MRINKKKTQRKKYDIFGRVGGCEEWKEVEQDGKKKKKKKEDLNCVSFR